MKPAWSFSHGYYASGGVANSLLIYHSFPNIYQLEEILTQDQEKSIQANLV